MITIYCTVRAATIVNQLRLTDDTEVEVLENVSAVYAALSVLYMHVGLVSMSEKAVSKSRALAAEITGGGSFRVSETRDSPNCNSAREHTTHRDLALALPSLRSSSRAWG